jgi:hypothetical protein
MIDTELDSPVLMGPVKAVWLLRLNGPGSGYAVCGHNVPEGYGVQIFSKIEWAMDYIEVITIGREDT